MAPAAAGAASGGHDSADNTPQATTPPARSYGLPAEVTLRPGTYFTVRIAQPLSSDRNHIGDTFVAHLAQPIVVDGVVVALRGQPVYGRVGNLQKQSADRPSLLGLELTSITLADGNQVPIHSQMINSTGGKTPSGVQAGTVAGTTAMGAVVGGAIGWGTGAAIGAGREPPPASPVCCSRAIIRRSFIRRPR